MKDLYFSQVEKYGYMIDRIEALESSRENLLNAIRVINSLTPNLKENKEVRNYISKILEREFYE